MKKGFIAFVKALLGVAKVVLAILGVLVLAVVASLLLSIPGGKRFSRYCSYPDMKALMDAERDDIVATVAYERGGTNYTFVVLKPCRFLASGCAVLVYDPEGRLFAASSTRQVTKVMTDAFRGHGRVHGVGEMRRRFASSRRSRCQKCRFALLTQ